MAITQKSTIKTEVYFSEDKTHRYLLRKEWDKNKKKAMIIMINPSSADKLLIDHTTMYVMNNLLQLGFGSVDILNIFSKIDIRISLKEDLEDLVNEENDTYIQKSATKVDAVIIAWGSISKKSKKIKERQDKIFEILKEHKEKVYMIKDKRGRIGFHPLAPAIRGEWELEKINIETK